uniref:SURF1-like protein n=1 Tax=Rhodosorus marinus TaxID=101924 RepID=A0A7S2ZCI5_9RHOD|mmetsp:Transcript_141/g.320  ORF Transcript_141/g.320 Transcript_141/m.320 type:complete len:306 (+) Transcript_141:760-1677(+)
MLRRQILTRSLSMGTAMAEQPKRRSNTSTILVMGIPGLLCFGLGVWQIYRYGDKVEKIEKRKAKLLEGEPVREFNGVDPATIEYRIISLKGTFLRNMDVRISPRTGPKEIPDYLTSSGGMGSVGSFLLSPLQLEDGQVVYINRGWIPRTPRKNQTINALPSNEVTVKGVVRMEKKPKMMVPGNVPENDQWFWADLPAMYQRYELDGPLFIVDAIRRDGTWELPCAKDLEEQLDFQVDPFTHQVYAFTWFALAACMAVIIRLIITRRADPRRARMEEILLKGRATSRDPSRTSTEHLKDVPAEKKS